MATEVMSVIRRPSDEYRQKRPTDSARSEKRSMTESQKPPKGAGFTGLDSHLAIDEVEMLATDHDAGGAQKMPLRQGPARRHVNQNTSERENIRMNPEPDARGDDQPEREVTRLADSASKRHGSGGEHAGVAAGRRFSTTVDRLKHRAS